MSCGQPLGTSTPGDDARFSQLAAAVPTHLAQKMQAAANLAGERRMVTSLFIDVVGSTTLAEQLDAEEWADIMNGAFDRLHPIIYHYEGTIARLLGDAVLAFFGAPVAHEDDPVRAVRAALDMLQATHEYAEIVYRQYGHEFAVRIGLNTGPVLVGPVGSDLRYDYTAMGGAVNLAARLQSAAQPMTALISQNTYRFVMQVCDCIDLGRIRVKGQTDPVHVYQVRSLKTEPGRTRGLAAAGLESPLVGRQIELTILTQRYEAVLAGTGDRVLLVGEPGLGKTRLITEWKAAVETPLEHGTSPSPQWVEGHCLSYGQGLAYHLLTDLLCSLIGVPATADEPEIRQALQDLTADLFGDSMLEVYPYLGHLAALELQGTALERVQLLDPEALQAQYLVAMRKLLRALAGRRPLVLVLDDLHWADPSSTELLIKLLPLSLATPLLLCMITRPERDTPGWKLVAAARDIVGESLTEINLQALSPTDSLHLVSSLLEIEALPQQVQNLILKKAEGNPLFVEEMIRMLMDRHAIVRKNGHWVAVTEIERVEIPDNLQGLLLARIDRLPDEAKHALRVASVIGRQFPVPVLEHVLDGQAKGAALSRYLSTLETAGLIRTAQLEPELAYLFRHILVQDAAYASLLASDRKRLHLAVGKTLERIYAERLASRELAPRLGKHFAEAGDNQRALRYIILAGDTALASFANQEAEIHFRRGLELVSADTERAHLLFGLGQALFRQSRFEEALRIWREAIELYQALGDSEGVARLYARSARAAWYGDAPQSLKLCREGLAAVASIPESPDLARLVHEAARACFFNGLPDEALPLCRRALDMAERLGAVDVQADALTTLGILPGQPLDAALEVLGRAVELAESAGLLYQAARAHMNLAHILYDSVLDLKAAREHDRQAAELSRQRGSITGQLLGLGNVTHLSLLLGDFDDVETTLQTSHQLLSEVTDPGTMAVHIHANEAQLLRCRGELAKAARILRACQAEARQQKNLEDLFSVDTDLADVLLESHISPQVATVAQRTADECLVTEAQVTLEETIAIAEQTGWSSVQPHCQLIVVRTRQERFQDAQRLLLKVQEMCSSMPSPFDDAYLWRAKASLAAATDRRAEAIAALKAAGSFYARAGMRWWWARTLWERAQAHVTRGEPADLEQAQAQLREARAAFAGMGASRYVEVVNNQLQALGEGVSVIPDAACC